MLTNYVHNISYLAERSFKIDSSDRYKAQPDGTFNLPVCFLPAGALITRVYLQMTLPGNVIASVGFNEEKDLFISNANLIAATPYTSAVIAKTKKDGAVILNIDNLTDAEGVVYVEYYLPSVIKTEI